ncbi:MAG: hypothetical protein ABIU87_06175, partial [Ornithinibacter sp.]
RVPAVPLRKRPALVHDVPRGEPSPGSTRQAQASLDSAQLLAAREVTVEENLNRHLCAAQEWMPRECVPSSLGRDFVELRGEAWSVGQSHPSPIARTALEVNLLTEGDLSSDHRVIAQAFGGDSAWGAWVNR